MPNPSPSQLCTAAADAIDALRATIVALNAANPISTTETDAVSIAKSTAVNALTTFASEAELHAPQSITLGGLTLVGPDFARRLVDQLNAGSLGDVELELVVSKMQNLATGYAAGQ